MVAEDSITTSDMISQEASQQMPGFAATMEKQETEEMSDGIELRKQAARQDQQASVEATTGITSQVIHCIHWNTKMLGLSY